MADTFHSPPSKRTLMSPPNGAAAKRVKQQQPTPPPLPVPPGHASLRILCHASHIGGFIGKSGSSIKQLQLETGSKIRVEDSLRPGSDDRVIVIVAPNVPFKKLNLPEFEADVSAVQEAALRVFEKVLEVSKAETASCRFLIEASQAGSVIGKGGKMVEKLRRGSGAKIRVLFGDQIPPALGLASSDEIVEIEGDVLAVKKGLLGVCSRLQACPQVEKSSIKESKPVDQTFQQTADLRVDPLQQNQLDFHADPPLQRAQLDFRADPLQQMQLGFCTDPPLQRTQIDFRADPYVQRTKLDYRVDPPLQPTQLDFHVDSPLQRSHVDPPLRRTQFDFRTDPPIQRVQSGFGVDPPLQRISLPVATSSSSPAVVGRPLSFEAERPSADSKPQQQEVVFKILCLNDKVGGVIGRGGSIVRALQEESGATISIGQTVTNCDERVVTVTSKEDVESGYSPAQRAVVLVFSRYAEAAAEKGIETSLSNGSSVAARLVVPSNQVGCLLGKGGSIVAEMRKATGANIRILRGQQVPKCVSEDDQVVEITGQFVKIQDALYQITGRLRSNLFPSKLMNVSGSQTSTSVTLDTSLPRRVGDPLTSQTFDGQATMRQGMDPLFRHHRPDHSPSTGFRTEIASGLNPRSFVNFSRSLAPANGGADHGSANRPTIVTNTTVKILVPESAISSVYGEHGSNLNRIRQISGAKVVVREASLGTRDRTVIISGTPDETQAAQSLLHAFILTGSS